MFLDNSLHGVERFFVIGNPFSEGEELTKGKEVLKKIWLAVLVRSDTADVSFRASPGARLKFKRSAER